MLLPSTEVHLLGNLWPFGSFRSLTIQPTTYDLRYERLFPGVFTLAEGFVSEAFSLDPQDCP